MIRNETKQEDCGHVCRLRLFPLPAASLLSKQPPKKSSKSVFRFAPAPRLWCDEDRGPFLEELDPNLELNDGGKEDTSCGRGSDRSRVAMLGYVEWKVKASCVGITKRVGSSFIGGGAGTAAGGECVRDWIGAGVDADGSALAREASGDVFLSPLSASSSLSVL